MIRLAVDEDMTELLRMSESFFDASGYSDLTDFNKDDSQIVLEKLIDDDLLLTDGKNVMFGFLVFPILMNASTLIAQELFWWVDEHLRGSGVGVEILKQGEKLAKEKGATALLMLSLNDLNGKAVNKLYRSMGYKQKESTFVKVL